MSSVDFSLVASSRDDVGKGASRRLRKQGKVPAIIYGGHLPAQNVVVEHHSLMNHLQHEAFYSHILQITVDGVAESCVLKDLQRHPAKQLIWHADFMRVSAEEKIRMVIPLHFVGGDLSPGVKTDGGMVTHNLTEVEVTCLPRDLPEYLEVDLSNMVLDQTLHLSDLKLPEGVTLVELAHGSEHDQPMVAIHKSRGAIEADKTAG